MNIGIYINNENISDVDCEDLIAGNPGIGGTEYCILMLAQTYKIYFPQDRVTLFVKEKGKLPKVDNYIEVEDIDILPEVAKEENIDILVISAVYNGNPLPQSFFNNVSLKKINTILWGHNFYLSDFCRKIVQCEYVKANVFVGRQQYDRYIDHAVIKKSTYIYNMYPKTNEKRRNGIQNHIVTYIGSLVPTKGFHVLADAWKEIIDKVPDAELNVIGSGTLYGRNSKLGKYGIAEAEYEEQFMPGVTDANGNILPSVYFHGVMGAEKGEIIQKTCVGVVNPTGRTETFGISALDFESLGVPVVTIAKGGFLDTVEDGETGILYSSTEQLAEKVVQLLQNTELNEIYGARGRKLAGRFAPEQIIHLWHELFMRVENGLPMEFCKPDSFMNNNLKQFRWLNRRVKDVLHIEYPISVIGCESFVRNLLRRIEK